MHIYPEPKIFLHHRSVSARKQVSQSTLVDMMLSKNGGGFSVASTKNAMAELAKCRDTLNKTGRYDLKDYRDNNFYLIQE